MENLWKKNQSCQHRGNRIKINKFSGINFGLFWNRLALPLKSIANEICEDKLLGELIDAASLGKTEHVSARHVWE